MANVEHSALTGSDLHEPKGADTATAKHVYVADGAGSGAWTLPYELIGILEDNKTSGTDGGSFTSGANRTRDLNTEIYDKYSTIAIASNQFTITPSGSQTFIIEWSTPAYRVGNHQSLLRRITATAADEKRGTMENNDTGSNTATRSFGMAKVTISAATTYEIRHICQTTKGTDGFGHAGGFGTEVYTQVKIYRTG